VGLILIAFLVVPLLYAERRGGGTVITYLICAGVGFLSVTAVLRYQYFGTRLALGSLLIAVPLTGLMLRRWGPIGVAIVAVASLWATWSSLTSEGRPVWGEHSIFTTTRDDQMFRYFTPEWRVSYESAAKVVDQLDAKMIGTYKDLPYPLWVLMRAPADRSIVDLDESDRAQYHAGAPAQADVIICSLEGWTLGSDRCYQGPGDDWMLYQNDQHLRVYVPIHANLPPPDTPGG
jgi:hypothetical protein